MMRLIRRALRQVGLMTLVTWGWQHRGSVVRGMDLARRAPHLLQTGRMEDLNVEARAIAALDGPFAGETDVRITGIDDGAVMLRDNVAGPTLDEARRTLGSVRDVLDVRTEATAHPTLDDALAATGR